MRPLRCRTRLIERRRIQRPASLSSRRSRPARAKAALLVHALPMLRRGSRTRRVSAQRMQRIVRQLPAPDEVPDGVEGFAGVAAAEGVVDLLEERCAVGAEIGEYLGFAVGGGCGLGSG